MATHKLYEPSNDTRDGYEIRVRALELAIAPGLSEEDIVNRAKAFEAFLRGD